MVNCIKNCTCKRHSLKVKLATSAQFKNKPKSPEHRAKIASALAGRKPSEACIEALIEHNKTTIVSLETRKKMSEARIGFTHKPESRQKMSEWQRGENGPRWIDGRSGLRGPNWRWIRLEILSRDNYTCQACGKQKDKRLQIHHLTPWEETKDNNSTNLISLCPSCHMLVEKGKLCLMLMNIPL